MKKSQLKTMQSGTINALTRAEMKKITGGFILMDCITAEPGVGPGVCLVAGFICCADLKCHTVAAGCPA